VTSGAAISALQEAGNKQSRDLISASYRTYKRECYLAIELMRQFYDETRSFRITGETGKYEFIDFNNKMMQGQPIPPAYEGQELEEGYVELFRKPVYDIVVKPQKRSPYSKLAQNELAKELYNMGFFNPQLAEQSMTALDMMEFDGIEAVKDKVQQGQTLMNMVNQLMQELAMLKGMMGVNTPNGMAMPVPKGQMSGGGMGQAQKNAMQSTMTSYGERLAQRAKPDMNNG
jgi:ribosomal protein S16